MSSPIPDPSKAASDGSSDVKWFAGLAMQAIIAKQKTIPDTKAEREEIALWSYRMAQAMTAMERQLLADE